jgi:hypothetical protein
MKPEGGTPGDFGRMRDSPAFDDAYRREEAP